MSVLKQRLLFKWSEWNYFVLKIVGFLQVGVSAEVLTIDNI